MDKVRSADGTQIAYEQSGSGQPLILIGGALCDRGATRPLATALEADFTVVSYDRRGRGDSGDTSPYAVAREVEDLGALITALGGTAAAYGHSSGAALLVEAAATGLPFTKVVLHEPPYGPDDPAAQKESDAGAEVVLRHLADGRLVDAVATFLQLAGMPDDAARQWAAEPGVAELAPTLRYDFAVMDSAPGGTVPFGTLGKVTQPALAVCGSASPAFMVDAARLVAKALPAGQYVELDGQDHVVPPEVLAPVLRDFLRS
ncbi:alpha/beta hydrolase fold protein [Kribbella flavida DSM 17836]|uniref:Alpha/beta hydrolase fold protein n=1 Tax=Kribbella flavida (strain DSM 17836 / JCM 10339 / NBRC 14399) TaxID=479435 RepID=D2PRL8_KRIFD|nr:alpha/beta hydrolase [Kribbella flavida]ADB34936.1 alpha/beta hydrolase fold protein [Kribbella flavida DSM 17836]